MANRIYSQVELLCEVKNKHDLVNKQYVDDAISARVLGGVSCVITEPIDGTYESTTMTLTQTGGTVNSDGVTLTEGMEFLYATKTGDLTQNGIYVVKTVPVAGSTTPSSAVASVSGSGITSATVDKTVFETKINTSGTTKFIYDGVTDNTWKLEDGTQVNLSDYGIVETLVGSDATDQDTIEVTYIAEIVNVGVMGVFERSERMNKSSQFFNGQIIPVWEGLIYKNSLFVLTTDETITLDTTSINYEKYKGAEEGAKKFKGNIVGDDATKVFTITHGLNTKDVVIKVYDATTDEQVYFSTKIVSENAIEVSSDVVLTPSDSFNVLVVG